MKRFLALVLAAILLLAATGCGISGTPDSSAAPAASESKPAASASTETAANPDALVVRLAFDSPSTPENMYNELSQQFKKEVESASGGSIIVEVFSDGQLGSERENFENVQLGTLDMSTISNASIGAFSPYSIAVDLPFMFPSSEAAHAALDGPAGQAIVQAIEAETGVKNLCFGEIGFRHMTTNKNGIRSVADMSGLKIRTMENEMYVSTYKMIGANSVPMAWSEVLSGLQQGTIDGLDAPLSLIISSGLDDLTDYLSLSAHFYNASQLIVNGNFFNGLTPEQQQILTESAKKASAAQRATLKEFESQWLEEIGANMEVIPVEEIDMGALKGQVEEIYAVYSQQIGGTYVEDLRAAAQAAS